MPAPSGTPMRVPPRGASDRAHCRSALEGLEQLLDLGLEGLEGLGAADADAVDDVGRGAAEDEGRRACDPGAARLG